MEQAILKVTSILEALPYIREFYNKTIVIKYGGAAMAKADLKDSFAVDVVMLKYVGMHPVIVHGGGPEINQMLKNLNLSSEFKRGHRVTDAPTMEVVEMILSGKVNKQIVSLIQSKGGKAIGISGRDGNTTKAEITKIEVEDERGNIILEDLGLVGKITQVDTTLIQSLCADGFIPVISPVAEDLTGQPLNINADTMAGAIASALKATKLILLTDTQGVLIDGELVPQMRETSIQENIKNGKISGGMIPKVQCCLDALKLGVQKAHIIDGRVQHSLLLELFTKEGIGTLIEI